MKIIDLTKIKCYYFFMKKFIAVVLTVLSLLFCCACGGNDAPKAAKGVWWWNKNLDAETYLTFADENSVTEIYYCDADFDEKTASFIDKAAQRDIKVYWLAGEYQWLDDSSPLYRQIERYKNFQAENKRGFAGIHLDIEPHQSPAFSTDRAGLLKKLIGLVYGLKGDFPEITFDFDIPFWIHDEITYGGETLPAYAHIIRGANRAFIMSYRDTAESIYSVAKEEVEYAVSINKTVILGVETYSTEGDSVSFMEEGKNYMNEQLEVLKTLIPENYGISVHQIKTWYDLKD